MGWRANRRGTTAPNDTGKAVRSQRRLVVARMLEQREPAAAIVSISSAPAVSGAANAGDKIAAPGERTEEEPAFTVFPGIPDFHAVGASTLDLFAGGREPASRAEFSAHPGAARRRLGGGAPWNAPAAPAVPVTAAVLRRTNRRNRRS